MDAEPGQSALLGAIEARAEEERARLLAEAEARVAQILAGADAECERLKAEALAGLERELAVEQVRLLGEARMHARTEGLGRRRAILEEAFWRAEERIKRLRSGPGAKAALAALAEEARAAVGEPCDVQVSAADWKVTAVSEDGRRRAENDLDGRLLRARAAAEHGVARRLFGGPGSGA